jgi:drug/metabolite transporter (DMT)-like permease
MNLYTSVGAVSVALWGAVLPLVRMACEDVGVLSALVVTQGVAGALGVLFMAIRRKLPNKLSVYVSRAFAVRLVFFVSHILLLYVAVQLVDRAALPGVVFCNYLWPTLVMVYSLLLTNIRIARRGIFAAGIAVVLAAIFVEFGSVVLDVSLSRSSGIAFFLAFLAANAWGAYSAFTRRYGDLGGGSAATPLFLLICGGLGLLLAWVTVDPSIAVNQFSVSGTAIVVGVCNFIAYLCWDVGMRRGNVVTLTLLADFIPWLSLLTFSALLGVGIENRTLVSAFLLVCGGITARIGAQGRGR